ncbi:MAG: nitrite reductase (NAD(P)H) small subunit [Firmicutes bacterium]|nr:nitrite reductase (NAD(P)H) small subunit [Bacillota bacterium]MCL5015429.1 nitrite reductase (NAD(P)H) small subunit [Bacillota bacterium]
MTWFKLMKLHDLEPKRGRKVTIAQCEIGIFRLYDGSLRAIGNTCPHRQGSLTDGIVSGHYVYCPLHDWKIDLNTGLAEAPDEGATEMFAVRVDSSNNVYVAMDDDMARAMCLNPSQSEESLSTKN